MKEQYFEGKARTKKGLCACVYVCVHTSKIGVQINMLKRGEKIHIAKRQHM